MLTTRGWWFLFVVLFLLALGAFLLANFTTVPAILAVTLFAWFVYEWVQFHFKSNAAVSRLRVRRWVLQGGRSTPMLWANVRTASRSARDASLITIGVPPSRDWMAGLVMHRLWSPYRSP